MFVLVGIILLRKSRGVGGVFVFVCALSCVVCMSVHAWLVVVEWVWMGGRVTVYSKIIPIGCQWRESWW